MADQNGFWCVARRLMMVVFAAGVLISCGEAAPPPDIELPTDHVDLGLIESDAVAEKLITVFNHGGRPLTIEKVTTSCHCTEGAMVASVVPPGGVGKMKITVDPSRVKGDKSTKTLTVVSDDPDEPMVELKVSATIAPSIETDTTVLDFGTLRQGESAERRMRLRQLQNTPLKVLGTRIDTSVHVKTSIEEVRPEDQVDPEKMEYDIVVELLPTAPLGKMNHGFIFNLNTREGFVTFRLHAVVVEAGNPAE